MTAQVLVGLAVVAARSAQPPVPWKELCLRYGMSRTRLWQLARAIDAATVTSPLPLAVCGGNLVETAVYLIEISRVNID